VLEHLLLTVYHLFKRLGLAGAFLSMLIENVGIPLPTEIGYVIASELTARGIFNYSLVVILLTLGHLAGSLISWGIGRWGNDYTSRKLQGVRRIVETREKLERWYQRYGDLTVFLTRFVGYVRPWSSFVAGFAKVGLLPFVVWTFLGSAIFNFFSLYLAGIFILVWRRYSEYHFLIALALLLTFFALIVREVLRGVLRKVSRRRAEQ